MEILTPTPIIKPEDFTEEDLRHLAKESLPVWAITSGATIDGNKMEFNTHRYLLPIYACEDRVIVWQKAAQMGATSYMLLKNIWWLLAHPGRTSILYFPTAQGVENLSASRVDPLLRTINDLDGFDPDQNKLALKKIKEANFYLLHIGGTASKDSIAADFVSFDEVRLVNPKDIDQARERISHSPYKLETYMSTCGHPGTDIAARFDRGTQHVWHSRCFTGSTKIWVRHKETGTKTTKSFLELQDCWQLYQALSISSQHKLLWRDITAFHNNGVQPTVSLLYKNGTVVECTPDHRFAWVSKKDNTRISYVPANEIMGRYRYGKYNRNNLLMAGSAETPGYAEQQVPYDNMTLAIIGAFIAEGSWKVLGRNANIAQLPGKHLYTLTEEWAKQNNIPFNSTSEGVDLSFHTRPDLARVFMQCGRGCENKRVPPELLACSSKQAAYILDGYLSGDGHRADIPKEDRHAYRGLSLLVDTRWDAVTTSRQLASDLQFLAMKIGQPTLIANYKVSDHKKKTWTVSYHPRAVHVQDRLNDELYTTYITEVKQEAEQAVYDITVQALEDRDHAFVLENGAVVHNCACPDGCDLARSFPDCVIDDPKRGLYLRCPKCLYTIKDPQNGRYVPMNPGAEYTSFHVSQLASKYISLKEIWSTYKNTTNMQEFYNAKLGLPYVDSANIGVTMPELMACVDSTMAWDKVGQGEQCAMGVDVGSGYNVAVIMSMMPNGKRRLRHVEIIENNNPDYYVEGKPTSPFERLAELMEEWNVRMAIVDAQPNHNESLAFAQRFPKRVFLAWYIRHQKDIVQFSDKAKTQQTIAKAGPLFKFKYKALLSRYNSLSNMLGMWKEQDIISPPIERLVQMCRSEETNQLHPESPAERLFNHLTRFVRRETVVDEETGETKYDWAYIKGDPHLGHACNYCLVALERLRRSVSWSFE